MVRAQLNPMRAQEAVKEEEEAADDDDDDLLLEDDFSRREKVLEARSKVTHPVHCPHYPEVRPGRGIWRLLSPPLRCRTSTSGGGCTSATGAAASSSARPRASPRWWPRRRWVPADARWVGGDDFLAWQVELRFAAQTRPGVYCLQVCLRSDSYLDCDVAKDVKVGAHHHHALATHAPLQYTVAEAKQVTSHPQWEFAEDDDDKHDVDGPSDEASEYTEDDEDVSD